MVRTSPTVRRGYRRSDGGKLTAADAAKRRNISTFDDDNTQSALRLLLAEDFNLHSHAWGLFGNASICFSIGCVCKLTWAMARFNAVRQLELQLRQQLGLR